ncbi:MAG: hypothetical protein ACYCZK_04600 [Microbacteriaceae bacterium]
MPVLHRRLLVAWLVLGSSLLGGCAPAESASARPDSRSALSPTAAGPLPAPRYATSSDALAAATQVYERYLLVFDQVLAESGARPERLETVLTGTALALAQADAAEFRVKGLRSVGTVRYRPPVLQAYEDPPIGISIYVCEDVSAVDLLDSSGRSLVRAGRNPFSGFEARLVTRQDGSLVIAERNFWSGDGLC